MKFEFQICPAFKTKPQINSTPPAWATTFNKLLQGSDIYDADPAFLISDVLGRHFLILNKFCVYRPQFILLTKDASERQHDSLTASDLAATYAILCGSRTPMYAFYNCGAAAGCSRNHKHVQLFYQPDFPLFPQQSLNLQGKAPYKYFVQRINDQSDRLDGENWVTSLKSTYDELLAQSVSESGIRGTGPGIVVPHNMVMTREWIMVIPRRRAGIGRALANSAGMLGMVWVSDEAQLQDWMQAGPANVLSELGVPSDVS